MTKKKWLFVLLAVFLAAAVCMVAFGDAIVVYVMPQAALAKALNNTLSQLEERYGNSPVSIIASNLDSTGRSTAQMKAVTENELAGEITYDMLLQIDPPSHQLFAEGIVSTAGNDLDLSVYLDQDFMALSSDDLLKGAYYGITYETFSDDIRSIPLVRLLLSENTLSGWETSVSNIQAQMGKSYQLPDVSQISGEDFHALLKAILLLDCDVEQVEMLLGKESVKCHRITFTAVGEEVGEMLGYLMDAGNDPDGVISAAFCVYEDYVIQAQIQGHAGDNSILYMLELPDGVYGTLTLRSSRTENGEESGFSISHAAQQDGDCINETWLFYPDLKATGEQTQLDYCWEPATGKLTIGWEQPIALNLAQNESGFTIQTEDFDLLMDLLMDRKPETERKPVTCTMTLQKGAAITTPGYKNLDSWSLEDLITLVEGIGSLFGLKIN